METSFPHDPIAAATHPDPYPYYADLVAHRPIYRDEALGLWVASSADAVSAVLMSDSGRVRPPAEPVPAILLGSPVADIFRRFVRMNDGERHRPLKQAVSATLRPMETTQIAQQCREWARFLLDERPSQTAGHGLEHFAFYLPVYVIASLLGVPREQLHQTAVWVDDVVSCLAPSSTPDQVARGAKATEHLFELFHPLVSDQHAGSSNDMLVALAREAKRSGNDDTASIVANGIGFMVQSYEATAGLIGNTLVALAAHHDVHEAVVADPRLLRPVVEEVLRYDSPVQNTRRFLARNGVIAGQETQAGDVVLVLVAAANRDPAVNAHPERFDPLRKERRVFTFGVGPHACPGDELATMIATAGVEQLLATGVEPERLITPISYRPSLNVRVALIATQGET